MILKKQIKEYLFKKNNKLQINSKDISKGDVFLALQGSKVHGNLYVAESLRRGAKYIITDNKNNLPTDRKKILVVKNSKNFLMQIAKIKRKNFKGQVIGITGSVGKTTLKENLKYFLSFKKNVFASIKSYNNYLGVLISLVNLKLKNEYAIFEIGTNNFQEISNLTSIVKPHQAIITNIYPTHLENFKNTLNIAKEKSDIFDIKKNKYLNLVIIPNSNSDEIFLHHKAKRMRIPNIFTFSEKNKSDFNFKLINSKNSKLTKIQIKTKNENFQFYYPKARHHRVYNLMICLIIFKFNKLDTNIVIDNCQSMPAVEGRGIEKSIFFHKKRILFIDESYNASPVTMLNSIDYFKKLQINKKNNKFLILGEMKELGKFSFKFHKILIERIIKHRLNKVILSGAIYKKVLEKISIKKNQLIYLHDEMEIMNFLKHNLHNNDTILIKCSNSTKVNKLANMLDSYKR